MKAEELKSLDNDQVKQLLENDRDKWIQAFQKASQKTNIQELHLLTIFELKHVLFEHLSYCVYGIRDDFNQVYLVATIDQPLIGFPKELVSLGYWHFTHLQLERLFYLVTGDIYKEEKNSQ